MNCMTLIYKTGARRTFPLYLHLFPTITQDTPKAPQKRVTITVDDHNIK